MAKITVGLHRELEKQVMNGDISYSRMIEILNEQVINSDINNVLISFFKWREGKQLNSKLLLEIKTFASEYNELTIKE